MHFHMHLDAGSSTQSALPDNIRTVAGSGDFQTLLKLHYFSAALTFVDRYLFLFSIYTMLLL